MTVGSRVHRFAFPVVALLMVLGSCAASAAARSSCSRKFPVATDGFVPFCSSQPIHTPDDRIERIVLSLHSSNFDAGMAFSNVQAALAEASEPAVSRSLIVAPQFLIKGRPEVGVDAGLVFWAVNPFWGSSKALTRGGRTELRLSAYEVLERLLDYLAEPKRFPNVQTIIVVGHSAGGQMVNRFAAFSRFGSVTGQRFAVRYVSMNPSSYLYFDDQRTVPGEPRSFRGPTAEARAACPDFDRYGYGLEKLYAVHRQAMLTPAAMRRQYEQQHVIYLVGGADTERGEGLSTQCAAEIQGHTRLERARFYYSHLIGHFGASIQARQILEVVPGVGHSGRRMLASEAGVRALLAPVE